MDLCRKFREPKLLIATANAGKVKEIRDLVKPFGIDLISVIDLDIPEPEEVGETFAEISKMKALYYARASNLPALADDSGLCVKALGGDPGLYSARWAGPEKDYAKAFKRIQDGLGDNADRTAHFVCALSLAWTDGHVETFEGRIEGEITTYPRGVNGFGYDPLFIPEGYDQTFAEMDHATKYQMSHRARALEHFITRSLVE
jgi:XTP/dITP diphosphohydrolase